MQKLFKHITILFFLFAFSVATLQSQETRKIIFGIDNYYPPYEYVDSDGNPAGFNVEVIKAIAKEMQIEVEFRFGVWSELRKWFDSSKIDVIQMFSSAEREKTYDFTVPFAYVSYAIFTRDNDADVSSIEELGGKKVMAQRNDLIYEYLISQGVETVGVDSPKEAIQDLSVGKYDAAVISKSVGLYYINKFKVANIKYTNVSFLNKKYCFAVKRGDDDIFEILNEGLYILKQNQVYSKIKENCLGMLEQEETSVSKVFEYISYIFIPLFILGLSLIFWNWQLRKQVKKRTKDLGNELDFRKNTEKLQQTLYNISESASTAHNLDELYRFIHTYISELVPSKNFYIALYDKNTDLISFPYYVDEFDEAPKPRKPGHGLTEYVLKIGTPLLASPELFKSIVEQGDVEEIGAPSIDWLGIPLTVDGETFGVVVIQSYTEGVRFSEEDKDLISFVSNQIAMTIVRRKAIEEVKALNAELEDRVIERTAQLEEALDALTYEIEERTQAQDALEKAQLDIQLALRQEKELGEMKSRFISTVSHEYRTPLTIILTSTYLLEKFFSAHDEKEFRGSLERIRKAIDAMTHLIDDVLVFNKSNEDNVPTRKSEIDLISLCIILIDEFAHMDKDRHKIQLKTKVNRINIKADIELLKKIISNLISNALKFSPDGKDVIIELNDFKDSYEFSITDNGIGIPQEEREHLFKPYHRFKNVGSIAGNGLGLSIVKRFADIMGGTVNYTSQEDKGTCFTLLFPKN